MAEQTFRLNGDHCTPPSKQRHDLPWQDPNGGVCNGWLGHKPAHGYALESLGSSDSKNAGGIE